MKHGAYNPLAGNILLVKKEATIYNAFMDVSTSTFVLVLWKLATEARVLVKASGYPEGAKLVCPAGTPVPTALPWLGGLQSRWELQNLDWCEELKKVQ